MPFRCSIYIAGVLAFLAFAVVVKSQPVEIVSADLRGASQPQVAVAPDHKVFVVFGKETKVYCAVSTNNAKSFLPPRKVADVPGLALGMRRGPRIVASDHNVAISAVSHKDGNLYAWTSDDGGQSWTPGVQINSAAGSAREGLHGMAGNQRGAVFVVWLDGRNKSTQLWGAGSHDGGKTWDGDGLIYQSPDGHICECCHPSVVFEPDGTIRVMWRNWLGGSRDIFTASSTDGGKTFGAATKLGSGTWPLNACPMDGGGLAGGYSVWRRESRIYYTDSSNVEHLLGGGKQPVVCLTQNGPYFVWDDGHGLMLKRPLSAPMKIVEAGTYPAMASASAGDAPILVWQSDANGLLTILAEPLR
jgi:hypothetical protein